MSLSPPFEITTIQMSMYDLADEINKRIQRALTILEKPDVGALAYDTEDRTIRVQKIGPNNYAVWDVATNEINVKSARETLYMLFAHMPDVVMVGTEISMDILEELANRQKKNRD